MNLVRMRQSWLAQLTIFSIFILKISETTSITSPDSQIPYAKYCNDVVPESASSTSLDGHAPLKLFNAHFDGGDRILGQQSPGNGPSLRRSVIFRTRNAYWTETDGVIRLDATLDFRGSRVSGFPRNSTHRRLRLVHYRPPKIPVLGNRLIIKLSGFWSSVSGQLCMVGSGLSHSRPVHVVLKLNYPNSSTILTSLVNGTLESLDASESSIYFQPITILGVSLMKYGYSLIDKEIANGGFSLYDNMDGLALNLESPRDVCRMIRSAGRFELDYMSDCGTVNCNPLVGGSKLFPGYMSFNEIECLDNGRVQYLFDFSDSSYNGRYLIFNPNTTFVAEGTWDRKKKRLALVACRIFNMMDSSVKALVGDCTVRLSLSFPAILSLRNRSIIVGQIWSNRSLNEAGYFGRIAFQSTANGNTRLEGLKYEYTEVDNVRISCTEEIMNKRKGRKYPDGYSSDMRFDMRVSNKEGLIGMGYSSPLSVGDKFYRPFAMFTRAAQSTVQVNNTHGRLLNISFLLSYSTPPNFKQSGESVDISAEGLYNTETGSICMIGCRHVRSFNKKLPEKDSVDCKILINVQYPPLNAKGSRVKGMIRSTRNKTDPFYFEKLELASTSIYMGQAEESIWRMDLEITMVLISNTLACIFVGVQLLHVRKQPDVLPFISVVMLVVLTLAHMIPLVLNFEALFLANRNRQNVFLGSGGWLEVNEVLVRVITMVAFLLQFRLLQLTWSARVGNSSQKNLWISDRKVLYLSLPLYIGGGLIAWFVHQWKYYRGSPFTRHFNYRPQAQSFWGDVKSYAGLVLDIFLLPQIAFNLFCDSKERALAPPFYVGTTAVRLLPHAYDLYRVHGSTWDLDNIYANPKMDYYSTSWDVIISGGGLLFVFVIFMQQRFGGRCCLPKRYRENCVYEKAEAVSDE